MRQRIACVPVCAVLILTVGAIARPASVSSGTATGMDPGPDLESVPIAPQVYALGDQLAAASAIGVQPDREAPSLDEGSSSVRGPRQSDAFAAVDACVQQEMSDKGIHGVSVALAVDGELAHTAASGVRRAGSRLPVDTETIFRINSTTKMMTAAAVMQQVEQNRLDLHAPLTRYVPELELREPWSAEWLTLHTLLANAGGVPDPYIDYAQVPRRYAMPEWGMDLSTWAGRLGSMHLYAPPGTFWNYSSPNFSLAGLAVEHVSGLSFADYVVQRLWRPSGMRVTTFDPEAVVASGNFSMGHVNGEVSHAPGDYQRRYAAPAGGAYSTPTELIRWAMQLVNEGGGILSAESVDLMTTPHFAAEAVPWTPLSSYGYGIFIDDYRMVADQSRLVPVMRHPGNGRGYSTEFVWVPELDFALAILMNEYSSMRESVDCALREVAGLEPGPPTGVRTSPELWGQYTGTYAITDVFGDRWTGHVSLANRRLGMTYTDWRLVPAIAAALPEGAQMQQAYLDTFGYTYDGNKTITFMSGGGLQSHAGWLRNRYFVGQRVGELPEQLIVKGGACALLELESGLDAHRLTVRSHGVSEISSWRNVPVEQDAPGDPASSRFKVDLDVSGELGYLTAWLFEESDDNLEMYVMQDRNADERFAWPEELVERLAAPGSQGLFVPEQSGDGDYQLWVHGESVNGRSSVFGLDVVAVSGDDLRLQGVPDSVMAGEVAAFEVCGRPAAQYETERVGIVEIDFGVPGAIARVPVYFEPGDGPQETSGAYLPLVQSRR